MPRLLRLLTFVFLSTALAQAQSARWEPASGDLPRDQTSQLSLIFADAEPKTTPAPPAVDGLAFVGNPGRSEQTSLNIGPGSQPVRRRTITYTFSIRPTRSDGEVRIPAFAVETDAGRLTVPPAGFRLTAATVAGQPLDQIATARFTVPETPVWAGQIFPLGFRLEVDRRYATNSILGGPLEWSPSPLVVEEWSKPSGTETTLNGQPRLLVSMETRAVAPLATTATLLPLPPATQIVNLPTGQANPFSLFGQTTFEQKTITTAPARLAINPLPTPAPADFIGAVGSFTLASRIVPEKATVGEPITWTLTLEGTGNWPAIDALRPRSLSRDFRVVNPRAQKTPQPDSLFTGSLVEDLVLIPQKPGRTTLGPYTLTIFNPATGAYETLRTTPVEIEIHAGSAGFPSAPSPSLPGHAPSPADSPSTPPLPHPQPPAPVAPLPSDPLPPGLLTTAPLSSWPRALFFTPLALLVPLVFWLVLAARHARAHDPLRARRAAHAELRQILTRLEASSSASPSDLLAWQHATRALFDLRSQTPTSSDLRDATWSALWAETERVLYRPASPLSRDWFAQAWQAHARTTPKPRSLLSALRPAHLFPRIALWLVLIANVAGASSSLADTSSPDALQLYARGTFPAAEAALRPAVAASPLDAAPRHNLALALAQQGKWDEATAHAYAAALQQPGDPALARLLATTAPKASYRIQLPPTSARLLPVRAWQHLAIASALALLTLVPATYLLALYLPLPRRRLPVLLGHCLLALSAASLSTATLALRSHGPAAHPSAVLVWRPATLRAVPTDVGEQKITADLPAGTLARVDKEFLGWRRLVLIDGNTGWVRSEPLVPLWRE